MNIFPEKRESFGRKLILIEMLHALGGENKLEPFATLDIGTHFFSVCRLE